MKVFVIAGEESGDILGASVLSALPSAEVRGIGGARMMASGLHQSIFPMDHLSVMGITEILPKLFFFKKLIRDTVVAIEQFQPDVVLTIDSPDFCFRVQRKIRTRGKTKAKQIHVVAPSVWAWRPGRAKKIARFLDGLICLFPFEPPYFIAHGLRAISIGHPSINGPFADADPAPFRAALGLGANDTLIGLYPGSRSGVMNRHLPLFIETLNIIAKARLDIQIVIPTFEKHVAQICAACTHLNLKYHLITDPAQKPAAMRACQAALSVTGTVGLELVIADVPHVAAYKMNALTWGLVRSLARTRFAHLANILAGRMVVPEFLQSRATPKNIAPALLNIINNGPDRVTQCEIFKTLRQSIGQGAVIPAAQQAVEFIVSLLGESKDPKHAQT